MPRKQRIDSITASVEIMKKATVDLQPPAHLPLSETEIPFWKNIIAEKAKSEWTAHDLDIASMLASSLAQLAEENKWLAGEGSVLASNGSNPYGNPRLRIIADAHARAMKYRQTLGIHSRGKEGEARDAEKRRGIAKGIEGDNPLEDDLLASPTLQ